MNSELTKSAFRQIDRVSKLFARKDAVVATILSAESQMRKVLQEQDLLDKATIAVQQARPLLFSTSIKQCESLANQAISSIFDLPYTVEWNAENQRFYLNKGDYQVDLVEAEGGGLNCVISFVFQVYLLVKLHKRRFMTFDEAFTQISDKYFPSFIRFVRQLCNDLDCDIILVSHDSRIQMDDVDHCYLIENGKSKRLK